MCSHWNTILYTYYYSSNFKRTQLHNLYYWALKIDQLSNVVNSLLAVHPFITMILHNQNLNMMLFVLSNVNLNNFPKSSNLGWRQLRY